MPILNIQNQVKDKKKLNLIKDKKKQKAIVKVVWKYQEVEKLKKI